MIQMQSMLAVADNSGARKVQCIKVLGGSKRRYAGLRRRRNDLQREGSDAQRQRKEGRCGALRYRSREEGGSSRRADGSYIRFDQNAAVLINNDGSPRGTRIFGPVARELRDKKYMKIVSLAPETL